MRKYVAPVLCAALMIGAPLAVTGCHAEASIGSQTPKPPPPPPPPPKPAPPPVAKKKPMLKLTFKKKGDQLELPGPVVFKTGSDVILPASDALLQKVLEAINALPADYHYRIEGHTDDRGSAALNQDLSQRRAKSVVTWLVKHGMDRQRLEAAGFGAARPVASNDTEDDRQKNRRVEIHITNLEAR